MERDVKQRYAHVVRQRYWSGCIIVWRGMCMRDRTMIYWSGYIAKAERDSATGVVG